MDKHDRTPLKRLNLHDPWQLLATGFGSGLVPKAPGTFGSLAALPVCMLLVYLPWYAVLAVVLITFAAGLKAAAAAEAALGVHDNSAVVIDEFAGMFTAVLFYPPVWYYALLAFVLFRIFDIFKPYPVSLADQRVGGALGVMLDDILAGIYAMLAAQLFFLLLA